MMFIFFGSGGTSSEMLGEGYELDCPNCHNLRHWQVIRTHNSASIFFIPIAKWGVQYWAVCPVCSVTAALRSEAEAMEVLDTASAPNPELRDELIRRASRGVR